MPRIVQTALPPMEVKRLDVGYADEAKADLKNLETWRLSLGRAVARCFSIAGLTQKEGAALIGRDQAQVARWIAGVERAQIDALLAVDQLRHPLLIALAEATGGGVEVETTVRIRRHIA